MAGILKKLSPGEALFHAGESSDGMYVIRKGQILVYLETANQEIPVAVATVGGMVGEMALIDGRPRSASARALDEVELSLVSHDDFNKILREIPKWFRSLMTALSNKLRDTNEHLQKLEEKAKTREASLDLHYKRLCFIHLIGQRMARRDKHGVSRSSFEAELKTILQLPQEKVAQIIDVLAGSGIIFLNHKLERHEMLSISNKGEFEKFLEFSQSLRSKSATLPLYLGELADMIDLLTKLAKSNAYDVFNVNLKGLLDEGLAKGFTVDKWKEAAEFSADLDESINVTRTSADITFRVNKKKSASVVQYLKALRGLQKI